MPLRSRSVLLALAASLTACTYISKNEYESAECALDEDGDGDPKCGADGTLQSGDCDDFNANMSHHLTEVAYDGFDNDCDGKLLLDVDGDTYPKISKEELAALNPDAKWPSGLQAEVDCNDEDAAIRPGREEVWYNDVDDACDEGDDFDADGDESASIQNTPAGASAFPITDCDDTDDTVGPHRDGADDVAYDGVDTDCDGANDFDPDGDGYMPPGVTELQYLNYLAYYSYTYPYTWDDHGGANGDCYDEPQVIVAPNGFTASHELVYPGAPDDFYDGIDSNCAGDNDFDFDVDGFMPSGHDADYIHYAVEYGLSANNTQAQQAYWAADNDCNDNNATIKPGALEIFGDGIDQDCDGERDFSPMGYGTLSAWSLPRPPVLGADDYHYLLITMADEYYKSGTLNEDRGVYLYWDKTAENAAAPANTRDWQGNSTNHPPLSPAFDAEFTSAGFLGGVALQQSGSTFVQIREFHWDTTASVYSTAGVVNSNRTGGLYEYNALDLRYNATDIEYVVLACNSTSAHLAYGEYDSGEVDDTNRQQITTGWAGVDCFLEMPPNTGSSTVTGNFLNAAGSPSAVDLTADAFGASATSTFTGYTFASTSTRDDWLLLGYDSGDLLVWGDSSDAYEIDLGGAVVVNADLAWDGSTLYVVAATDDNEMVFTYGDPSSSMSAPVVVPMTVATGPTSSETLDVEGASIYVDTNRIVLAASGYDSTGAGYVGWTFIGR